MREWPTLLLICLCYLIWGVAMVWFPVVWAIPTTALTIALHASLQHEALHGHPFRNQTLNAVLVFPSLNLAIPYLRFRDTHLKHHKDAMLTDPYDDPETNYLDPIIWDRLPHWQKTILRFNNTLAGRMFLGPLIGQYLFMKADMSQIVDGNRQALLGWCLHVPAMAAIIMVVNISPMPIWAYLIAAYLGLSLLKIRTFLEHQAHTSARGRTVVIEDRGPLAYLFLNNNFHVVHHMHPSVAWYKLPALYFSNRRKYLRRNHGYVYKSYADIIQKHFWHAKDPVQHPIWRGDQRQSPLHERAARKIQSSSQGTQS